MAGEASGLQQGQKLSAQSVVSITTCKWVAGGVSQHVVSWREITSDHVILDLVQNDATMEFKSLSDQENRPVT